MTTDETVEALRDELQRMRIERTGLMTNLEEASEGRRNARPRLRRHRRPRPRLRSRISRRTGSLKTL